MVREMMVAAAGAAILSVSASAASTIGPGAPDGGGKGPSGAIVLAVAVGASVTADDGGVDASVGVGSASVGAGVGSGSGGVGAGVDSGGASVGGGAGASVGGGSAGGGGTAGVGVDGGGGAPAAGAGSSAVGGSPASGGSAAGASPEQPQPHTVGPVATVTTSDASGPPLPTPLAPSGEHGQARMDPESLLRSLPFAPGTPVEIVSSCRESIITAARPHGVVHVDASSVGLLREDASGMRAAPLEVRVIYANERGREMRQSRITCLLDRVGTVVALR